MRVNIVWGRYFPFVSFVVLTAFDSTEKSDSSLHKCPSLRNCRKCSDGYFFSGYFNYARARCKTCLFIHNVEETTLGIH